MKGVCVVRLLLPFLFFLFFTLSPRRPSQSRRKARCHFTEGPMGKEGGGKKGNEKMGKECTLSFLAQFQRPPFASVAAAA